MAGLEQWLLLRAGASRARRKASGLALDDTAVPQRYRRLCQQLALARERGYSPQLVQRLQQLMQQGHSVLYRTRPTRWRAALEFLVADFPLLVRSQARSMWVALAMFALPAIACFVLAQVYPDLIHTLMDNRQIAAMERMYDPAAERLPRQRYRLDDVRPLHPQQHQHCPAHFASGLLAGLGTLLVLLFNGVTIGAVAGHLQHIGHGGPFWRFVVGHGAFELTAIVIAGGAGLQLGMKLLAPAGAAAWMRWSTVAASVPGCAWAWRSCCWSRPSSKRSGRRSPKSPHGSSSASPECSGPACCCGCGVAGVEAAMRIDRLDVVLRARSGWEAMELGSALARRHARAVGQLAAGQCSVVRDLQRAGMVAGCLRLGLAGDVVVQAAVRACAAVCAVARHLRRTGQHAFGAACAAPLGQQRFLGLPGLASLSALRSLCLPVNLLEGNATHGPARSTPPCGCRRRRCGDSADRDLHGVRSGAGVRRHRCGVHVHATGPDVRILACGVGHDRQGHAGMGTLGFNLACWLASVLIGPFFVGAGFGLYLNRRTQMEAWDVEIALRRLRDRLLPAASTLALLLCLALPLASAPVHAQDADAEPRTCHGQAQRPRHDDRAEGDEHRPRWPTAGHHLRWHAGGHRRFPPGGEPRL
jgi:hypothetical protein